MKICLLGPAYPLRGGISHYHSFLYLELSKTHDVQLISFSRQYPALLFPGSSQLDESKEVIRVPARPVLDSINPWTWIRTATEIRRLKPDLLVIQWWHPFFGPSFGTVAYLTSRIGGIRVCFLCHNVFPHDRSWVDGLLTRLAFRWATAFIVQSEADKRQLLRLRPDAVVEQTPHPVYSGFSGQSRRTATEAREYLGITKNSVLLFFGYVRPYKGLVHLIRSMPTVLASIDCLLLIVGEFYEDKGPYLREMAQLGLSDHVRVLDRYVPNEELAAFFDAADVVVLPYISATQSGAVQMAYGFDKPVITTKVGGLPEAVRDGETGYVVPPGDPGALADAILRFYEHNMKGSFSENVRRLKDEMSWRKPCEAIEKVGRPYRLDGPNENSLRISMTNPPRVSIITVVYNGRDQMEKTIISVLDQSYPNIQFLIFDGGSEDGTVDIIRRYGNRIGFWKSEPDLGLYDAMNKGIEVASGDYLWFINAGDEIYDRKTLENILGSSEPPADVYYGDTEMIDPGGKSIGLRSRVTAHALPESLGWHDMQRGMAVCHQSFIVRRAIAPAYDLSYRYCADIDWIIRCLKASRRVVNTHAVLSRFETGGVSKRRHGASLRDRFRVLQRHFGVGRNLVNHLVILSRAGARLLWGRSGASLAQRGKAPRR
jgi:glycosyltransferase involved in cell wall biosynthesis